MTKPFKPMLAKDCVPAKLRYPICVQIKLDGIRVVVKDGVALTRTLKRVQNEEIQDALGRPQFEGFDGEIIVGDPTAEGCMQATSSFVMSRDKRGADWTYYVFDLWNHPGTFVERHDALHECGFQMWNWSDGRIQVLDYITVENAEELEAVEARIIAKGHEGCILRGPNSRYKFGRSSPTAGECLKLKRFQTFEVKVVAPYEEQHNGNIAMTNALGRTERSSAKAGKIGKGVLGGFYVIAINGPSEGVEFKVGTGFSAAQRVDFWNEWHNTPYPERIATVKSFPVGVKDRPRFPVFVAWRHPDDFTDKYHATS